MSYRDISKDRVLEFPATPGFKEWEPFFTEESTTHPAKMNLNLLRWILDIYTKPGEVVLDPMAGTGSTIILAALMGRHGVAVEYEPRFCDMIRANIELTERQTTLMPKGRMTCIQGDARELSKLLSEADAIVTSPPYSECEHDYRHGLKVLGNNFKGRRAWEDRERAELSEQNIGRLPHGDIDAVITSPPYEGSYLGGGDQEARRKRLIESGHDVKDFFGGRARGATLRHYDEVDAVITSPPYSEGTGHGGGPASEKLTLEKQLHLTGSEAYSKSLDAVVTSPPYEGLRAFHDIDFMKNIVHEQNIKAKKGETKAHYRTDEAEFRYLNKIDGIEYEQPENIDTLKGETYLQAMLQVYRECWKVLKVQGKLIIVVKNFIRDKSVVRLDLDTIKLCEAAGFTLMDRWYFKLPMRSFWRILYKRRFPEVPEVEFEDVLIFDKGVDIPRVKVKEAEVK